MQHYVGADPSLLRSSMANSDPLGFVLLETMIKAQTRQRAPKWTPALVIRLDGFRQYQRGREMIRQVDEMCNQMWLQLVQGVLQAHHSLMMFQAGAIQRQLEWAEELRRQRDLRELDLEFQYRQLDVEAKRQAIQERFAAARDARQHGQQLELEKVRHVYAMELEALRQGQNDPYQRAQRYRLAMDSFKDPLEEIAKGPYTTAVKNQMSRAYLEALQLILR